MYPHIYYFILRKLLQLFTSDSHNFQSHYWSSTQKDSTSPIDPLLLYSIYHYQQPVLEEFLNHGLSIYSISKCTSWYLIDFGTRIKKVHWSIWCFFCRSFTFNSSRVLFKVLILIMRLIAIHVFKWVEDAPVLVCYELDLSRRSFFVKVMA